MTAVEICNSALLKIGAEPIAALTDDNKEGRACNTRFDHCRQYVLRMHPWNCAISRVTLSPLSSVPAFYFTKEFQLPADCLRVLLVNDGDCEYRIEGRKILTDESTVELKYVKNAAATELDSMCAEAVSLYLAWDISKYLSASEGNRQELWAFFREIISKARFVDATEDPNPIPRYDDWLRARNSGSGFITFDPPIA